MFRLIWSTLNNGPCLIALLLATLVIAAPIVNAKGRPPDAVFLILPETATQPAFNVQATALGGGCYVLTLHASGFVFTDLCVAEAEAVPIGHAHVHVNNRKVASAFAPVVEIGPLAPGTHVIDVVLRGQDHRPIIAQGKLVQRRVQITVPAWPV